MASPGVGSVVVIDYPYSDGVHSKVRPALLLGLAGPKNGLFCMITSKPYTPDHDIPIPAAELRRVPLNNPHSVVRPKMLFTLETSGVRGVIGSFSKPFMAEVKAEVVGWITQS